MILIYAYNFNARSINILRAFAFKTNKFKIIKIHVFKIRRAKKRKFGHIFKLFSLPKMAPIRFVIPLQRKDLLRGDPSSQYVVENEYSIRELKTKLVVIFDI